MRSPEEMLRLFGRIVQQDERIRVLTLEGSRVNPDIIPDRWQDYDITFLVNEMDSFLSSDDWLDVFGDRIFMQKPEAMQLFLPDMPGKWFSYLMLFADGIKIDLTLVPVGDIPLYFSSDPLIRVLIDKDGVCPEIPEPTDESFWIQEPCQAFVYDSANEFYFTGTYVARGLLREELLFAASLFEEVVRRELLRMLGYLAGVRKGFPLNAGKREKFLPGFLTEKENSRLRITYEFGGIEAGWKALETAWDLFDEAMKEVCEELNYPFRSDKELIRGYVETLKKLQR